MKKINGHFTNRLWILLTLNKSLVKNSFWRNSVTYATPCCAIGHFVFWHDHVTYRTLCYASGDLVIYREFYGLERVFLTLRRFSPCTPSWCFQEFPGAGSLTSKLAVLLADPQNKALAQLFVWITAIHNKTILVLFKRFDWPATKNLVLRRFEHFHNRWAC